MFDFIEEVVTVIGWHMLLAFFFIAVPVALVFSLIFNC